MPETMTSNGSKSKETPTTVGTVEQQAAASRSGKFIFANGDTFEGEYTLTPSGSIERCGAGTLRCRDGVVYAGQWRGDQLHGPGGSFTHPSGMRYEGEFANGKFEGVGCYSWPDGSRYAGQWRSSKLCGRGEFTDPNGQVWTGQFDGDCAARLKFKLNM